VFEREGAEANDLADGDSGCGSERVVRKKKVAAEPRDDGQPRAKKSKAREIITANGFEWYADETFDIDRIIGKKMVEYKIGKSNKTKLYPNYLVLWEGFPPETASWEDKVGGKGGIPRALVDEYEAAVDAEAVLDAEEADDDASDDEPEPAPSRVTLSMSVSLTHTHRGLVLGYNDVPISVLLSTQSLLAMKCVLKRVLKNRHLVTGRASKGRRPTSRRLPSLALHFTPELLSGGLRAPHLPTYVSLSALGAWLCYLARFSTVLLLAASSPLLATCNP
jgi:hypothetical protein